MKTNRIMPADNVEVQIYNAKGLVDTFRGTGYHTVRQAVQNAYNASSRTHDSIVDYVYDVRNLTRGTEGRYLINAGGHLRILPEVRVAS